jgi:tetratricopeptide (TPR) repeat protein
MPVRMQLCRKMMFSLLGTIALIAAPGVGYAQSDSELPLSGPAYEVASQAYEALGRGEYSTALEKVREAIRQRPDVIRLKRMLIEILEASGRLEEADHEAAAFIAAGNNDAELVGQRSRIRRQLAERVAESVYRAFERGDTQDAAARARQAVEYAPDVMAFRQLLIIALLRGDKLEEMEQAAAAALEQDEEDVTAIIFRAYARQRLGAITAATEDYDKALEQSWLTEQEMRNVRLIVADAALAANNPQRAISVLSSLNEKDDAVVARLAAARAAMALPSGQSPHLTFSAPNLDCRVTPYGRTCSPVPGTTPIQAVDPGFEAAAEAYRAYSAKDIARATAKAQEAVRLAPENPTYQNLLTAVQSGAKVSAPVPVDLAFQAADAAYRALARKDSVEAIAQARKAAELTPSNPAYRLLLISALATAGQRSEAERVANAALNTFPRDAKLLAQRGYVRQQLGKPAAAAVDFTAALRTGAGSSYERRNLRLALADAALAASQPQLSLDTLTALGNDRGYAVASRRGFALAALKRHKEAEAAFAQAAAAAKSASERSIATSARIGLLVDLDRRIEADQALSDAIANGQLAGLQDLDIAYLATRVGNDELADQRFARAQASGRLKNTSLIDAAYAAKRLFRNDRAQELLKAAIDAEAVGALRLDPQYLFGLRRENSELSRVVGAYSSLSYGAVGVMPGSPLVLPSAGGNVLQAGSEIYLRPPGIGYRNGAIVDFFARSFTTLQDETGGPAGVSTMQGAIGARWKPFGSYNLVLEASRLFPIGEFGRHDTLLRAAFSDGGGTDLRVDSASWWMWQIYGELGRYLENPQTVASFEARAGRSFLIPGIGSRTVVTPFLSITGSYDKLLATPEALGAGPGLNIRQWFREDKYTAPMSYIDINLQYRFKIGGDDRAEGLFAGITVAY